MREEPFTLGELSDAINEWKEHMGSDSIIRFSGEDGEEVFFRFKTRGKKVLTMELRNPDLEMSPI